MKKRKINWRKGFIKSSLIISIFLLLVLGVFVITGTASTGKTQQYIEVKVKPGDTLWAIADRYDNNQVDLRKLIYEIKKLNNINSIIYPGQVVKVPVY
ncbi:MAG: LysM peptidoglycan-binding domain-containing protein [Clostridia bacterium]|nr:LysM peptidoglycan-binding domain-containing protein [Clostridia bacterium]